MKIVSRDLRRGRSGGCRDVTKVRCEEEEVEIADVKIAEM